MVLLIIFNCLYISMLLCMLYINFFIDRNYLRDYFSSGGVFRIVLHLLSLGLFILNFIYFFI